MFASANEYTFECKATHQEQRSGCDDQGLLKILCKGDMKIGLGSSGGILDGLGSYATFSKTYKKRSVNEKKFIMKLDSDQSTLSLNEYIKYEIVSNTNKSTIAYLNTQMGHSRGVIELFPPSSNSNLYKYFFEDIRSDHDGWYKEQGSCELLSKKVKEKEEDPFVKKQKICSSLGFKIGTQENGNCVLKIYEIETNLSQQQETSGGQLTETDKLIRQQRLNQSLMLMQQGLNLMNPPQPKLNCRTTLMGWTCY